MRRLPKLMKPLTMPVRAFAAMDKPDTSLFDYKFTN